LHRPFSTESISKDVNEEDDHEVILESLNLSMMGNGRAKHTEAKMINPASIKQNRKRRMRKLTVILSQTTSRDSGEALHESCCSSLLARFASPMSCKSDIEM